MNFMAFPGHFAMIAMSDGATFVTALIVHFFWAGAHHARWLRNSASIPADSTGLLK